MNSWMASSGPNHFLISDNTRHFASGWHVHGGAGEAPGQDIDVIAIDDEQVIMKVIREFTDRI